MMKLFDSCKGRLYLMEMLQKKQAILTEYQGGYFKNYI